ncbi:MAG: polyprenyl synthetase family protein [Saprospiraceae bacterium]
MDLNRLIADQFEAYLANNRLLGKPATLYDPINYLLGFGGKRIRPQFLILSHSLFSKDISLALPAALALEWFHNFTLAHDDIMDQATLRRGQAAVHMQYSVNAAILSGDVLMIKVYQHLLDHYTGEQALALLRLMTQAAVEVCEGQQLDMDFETKSDINESEYLQMIHGKTASLIAAALEMGAVTGGALQEQSNQIYQFGISAGVAFQIQDDLLDAFGTEQEIGKKPGGDILQNKKTLLFIKAHELATEHDRLLLNRLYADPQLIDPFEKIRQVREIFERTGSREYSTNMLDQLYADAKQNLIFADVDQVALDAIWQMTDKLLHRKH